MPHQAEMGGNNVNDAILVQKHLLSQPKAWAWCPWSWTDLFGCMFGSLRRNHIVLSPKDIGYPRWKRGDLRATKTTYESTFCAHE